MHYDVILAWQATYSEPIQVEVGGRVRLTDREDDWEGHTWLWAISDAGLEGWIPDSIVHVSETGAVAKEAYSAMELSCVLGEVLLGEKETHGWVLCHATNGSSGWVPRRNLRPARD